MLADKCIVDLTSRMLAFFSSACHTSTRLISENARCQAINATRSAKNVRRVAQIVWKQFDRRAGQMARHSIYRFAKR